MLIDVLVTLTIAKALGLALRSERDGQMHRQRLYNNRSRRLRGPRRPPRLRCRVA